MDEKYFILTERNNQVHLLSQECVQIQHVKYFRKTIPRNRKLVSKRQKLNI